MEENTTYTTDRISVLPDSIVHQILSYLLDDPKSCVRMSVLSKEWFALTASFPILYFHQDRQLYKYVQYTMSRFCKQNISAHTLDISANIRNLEQREIFGRCLDLVLEKGLQVMDIHFAYYPENLPMLCLPNTLLSASSLTSLTLLRCELPSSLMVGVVNLQSLRLLSLSYIPVDEGVNEYLTKGCPLLEEIYLTYCYGSKTFCVKRHHNLQKVEIYSKTGLERIDVDAPNLSYFLLENDMLAKAPSMFMASCKKLTTFCYSGSPLKRLNDFLYNFSFLENVSLEFSSPVDNLKLSHHFLRRLKLESNCDLKKIDLNTPSLLLFEYCNRIDWHNFTPLSREDLSLSKGCMKCETPEYFDIFWFEKLRKFLEKNNIFKVLKLVIRQEFIDVDEIKLIESPPYELKHVELKHVRNYFYKKTRAKLDAVFWCCRPRSLTLELDDYIDKGDVEYTYEKLLQQEDEGQTNIKFVLISYSKREQQFSDLNSLLEALYFDDFRSKITFIKEEAIQEAG